MRALCLIYGLVEAGKFYVKHSANSLETELEIEINYCFQQS